MRFFDAVSRREGPCALPSDGYWDGNDEILYARLGKRGFCFGRGRPHPELATGVLPAAGLVSAEMVLARMQRRRVALDDAAVQFVDDPPGLAFAGDSGDCSDGGSSCDGGGD